MEGGPQEGADLGPEACPVQQPGGASELGRVAEAWMEDQAGQSLQYQTGH